jgi:hypothetical protein
MYFEKKKKIKRREENKTIDPFVFDQTVLIIEIKEPCYPSWNSEELIPINFSFIKLLLFQYKTPENSISTKEYYLPRK